MKVLRDYGLAAMAAKAKNARLGEIEWRNSALKRNHCAGFE
jgi:hypothetical protein